MKRLILSLLFIPVFAHAQYLDTAAFNKAMLTARIHNRVGTSLLLLGGFGYVVSENQNSDRLRAVSALAMGIGVFIDLVVVPNKITRASLRYTGSSLSYTIPRKRSKFYPTQPR